MAITIKSDTLYSGLSPTITLIGGSDTNQRLLLACAWNNGDGSAAAGLSVGGVAANFIGNRVFAGGVEASVSVFEMQNPAAGSYVVSMTTNGVGNTATADIRWRVIEIDNVAAGGGFASNVLNSITTIPATLNLPTTDTAAGDFVFVYHLVGEGWVGGATITNTPTFTSPQTVNVNSFGAVSAHRSGYFTADSTNPTVVNQIAGFATPGGNLDRTTAIAVRFKESAPLPDFTIAYEFEPNETVTITAANYPSAPTQITLSDVSLNTITLPLTATGGNNYTFTVPALPAAGFDAEYIKFGSVSATVGSVIKPSVFQVAATQTLATLAADFDDYVFQGWTPQPAVGDQLVTVTAEGVFNSNGDYTFYAEGVYPVWYVDGTGQAYGRTIDTSGLDEFDTVATPSITPESGTYSSAVTVAITTATSDAEIRYSTDGIDVTSGSTLYAAPFSVADSATVKARGFKSGMTDSEQASQTYVINSTPIVGVDQLSTWQPEYTHAIRINQIIDAAGLSVAKVSVQQQEYIYALKVNEIIAALNLSIKPLSVQQPGYMTALTINAIIEQIG